MRGKKEVSKSLKRHQVVGSDELSNHKVKVLKKREMERKLVRLKNDDYLDDEVMSRYANDPRIYRAIKEFC